MNFLAEILTSATETQLVSIKEKTPQLISQIGRLKVEVKKYLDNTYVNFKVNIKKSNILLERAHNLNNEMEVLRAQIDSLVNRDADSARDELEKLYADYKEAAYSLDILTKLVQIDDFFKQAEDSLQQKKYVAAADNLCLLKQTIKSIPDADKLDIIKSISETIIIKSEIILSKIGGVWRESVTTTKETEEDKVTVTIKISTSSPDDLAQSITALGRLQPYPFEVFARFLLNEVLLPIIINNTIVETIGSDDYETLSLKINKSLEKCPYHIVFNNIRTVFEFLTATVNFEFKKDLLLLGFVGQIISETFCDNLIKNCLADTVPSSQEDLKKYDKVIEQIELLQGVFTECQFFNADNQSILEYANNVDILFANKTCQIYKETARNILKKDLHNMVEVEDKQHDSFPKCSVSRNVSEYLDLAKKMLDQASISSDMCAGRLVYTATEIFEFYWRFIPEYHKKLLETIPQQVALFHNNCMYIAHELSKNENYKKCVECVHNLETAAKETFLKYMLSQIKQIEDILRDSDLKQLGQTDDLHPNCEKSVRQCLRQLELLKTVWQKVLSTDVYNRTMGELLNSFVDYLINLVVGVEDISAGNCTLLVNIYGIVKTRSPKLFMDPKEVHLYVNNWSKFNELILVLNSSLSDINDRWADGKGPLALEFQPEEIKSLIRAIFQNTDRRAAVLSRII